MPMLSAQPFRILMRRVTRLENERAHCRHQRDGEHERAHQGKGVGQRQRPEDAALDGFESEHRDQRRDDDEHREKRRPADIQR